jgi:hypothetical protein
MPLDEINLDQLAAELIRLHGQNARQKVVDEIMRAVRSHEVAGAKRWDELGEFIDLRLTA